jgi:hypothetical protein
MCLLQCGTAEYNEQFEILDPVEGQTLDAIEFDG